MTLDDAGFPDATEMVDPVVTAHLTSGKVIQFHEVSVIELGKRLHHWGFVVLADGEGEYCVLFKHGVAALTAGAIHSPNS